MAKRGHTETKRRSIEDPEQMAKIKDLEKKLSKTVRSNKAMKKQIGEMEAKSEKMAPVITLLDNLVRAAETGDITAVEQTAGAGREFLSKNPA
jgi:hypothetical protein